MWVIQAAYRPAGGPWERPRDLSRLSLLAAAPQVVFDGLGDAIAVWQASDGAHQTVQTATRLATNGRWSAPRELSAPGGDSLAPQVAVDASGNALAIWTRSAPPVWTVQVAYRPARGSWQPAVTIAKTGTAVASPQVAFDPQGNALALWAELAGTNWEITTAFRAAGGGWSLPQGLAEAGENPSVEVEVGVDGRGDATVVWEGVDGTHPVIQTSSSTATQQIWSDIEDLSVVDGQSVSPQLAVDARGDAAVVWTHADGGTWTVQVALRRGGGAWGKPRNLTPPGRKAVAPDVALDARGDALAVWTESLGGHTIVRSSFRPAATGRWSPARSLSQAGGDALTPTVAVGADGNGVIVWSRFSRVSFLAQAAGFDGAGPSLRALAVPRAGTVGVPLAFSVDPRDTWSEIRAVRWSFGDGRSATGAAVEHAYKAAGTYTVRVTASDALGRRTTATRTVAIAAARLATGGRNVRPPA